MSVAVVHPDFLSAALAYAERGWHVAPCRPGQKTPITEHGFKDATTDPAKIRTFWGRHPDANILIATGASHLVVADIDVKHPPIDGYASLRQVVGSLPDDTLAAETPSGGAHYFYGANGSTLGRLICVAPGVDILGNDGYILAPPSIIDGRSGAPANEHGSYRFVMDLPIIDAPGWLLSLAASKSSNGGGPKFEPTPEDAVLVDGAGRNDYLMHYSRRECTRHTAGQVMALVRAENERVCRPAVSEDELQSTIFKSVPRLAQTQAAGVVLTREPKAPVETFTFADLEGMAFPPLTSLPVLGHPEVIVKGFSHILSGDAKAGKTTLLVSVLKEWTDRGETVRIFSEESKRLWHARFKAMGPERFDTDRVTVVPALGMSYQEQLDMATGCAETVIVVDTIRSLWGIEDEKDNSEAIRASKPWVAMARTDDRTLVLQHHDRKAGGANGLGISGAGAWLAVVDMAVMVGRDPNIKVRRKVETLGRVVDPVEFMYELVDNRLVDLGSSAAVQLDEVKRRVLDVLDAERAMTTAQVRGDMEEPKPSPRQILYALDAMASIGNRIHRIPDIVENAAGRKVTWLLGPRNRDAA